MDAPLTDECGFKVEVSYRHLLYLFYIPYLFKMLYITLFLTELLFTAIQKMAVLLAPDIHHVGITHGREIKSMAGGTVSGSLVFILCIMKVYVRLKVTGWHAYAYTCAAHTQARYKHLYVIIL
jgi:hypothetical protein